MPYWPLLLLVATFQSQAIHFEQITRIIDVVHQFVSAYLHMRNSHGLYNMNVLYELLEAFVRG